MARYRKRPLEVEAEQFTGLPIPGVRFDEDGTPHVVTIQEQWIVIAPGEWVIQESDGVHAYPCDAREFERIYEAAE
jgi:hypothetical protein